jgi:hypothetical protein
MPPNGKFASADRENFRRFGYFIEDNRPMEKLAKIIERPISEAIESVGDNDAGVINPKARSQRMGWQEGIRRWPLDRESWSNPVARP